MIIIWSLFLVPCIILYCINYSFYWLFVFLSFVKQFLLPFLSRLKASAHYMSNMTQQSYDYASHEQHDSAVIWLCVSRAVIQADTTRVERWAPRLAHAHFTFCHSKCTIEVHGQLWRFNMSNPHDLTHETIVWLGSLRACWRRACVAIPVAELFDRESCSVWRPLRRPLFFHGFQRL